MACFINLYFITCACSNLSYSYEIWYGIEVSFSTVYSSFSKSKGWKRVRDNVGSSLINPSLSVLEKTHEKIAPLKHAHTHIPWRRLKVFLLT